jgi:DNA-cytosine methyltransferase
VLSLFDGMSCGQLALNRAGIKYDKYFASEIDKYAIKVTQANYPETIQLGDVTQVKAKNLPKIDLLIGGSPCQGFSFAGKQLNFNDPRSALFFEFVRLLKECKPKYFLLENVKMKKEYQDVISEHLGIEPIEINSSLVSAQNRRRLYWCNWKVNQPKDLGLRIKDIRQNEVEDKYLLSEKLLKGFSNNKEWFKRFKVREDDEICPCLTARYFKMSRTDPYIYQNGKPRKLTPIECERLQTVPDNYTNHVSNTQRYKMLGNGWTIDVIAHIFKNLTDNKSKNNIKT